MQSQSLKDIIALFRKELDAALATGNELPNGTHLEAERAILSLQCMICAPGKKAAQADLSFAVRADAEKNSKAAKSGNGSGHTVTIEFKITRGDSETMTPAQAAETIPTPLPTLSEDNEAQIMKSLVDVLGPPGFDSSARATVFREALASLSDEEARGVIASLAVARPALSSDVLKRARHLIANVLRSGPVASRERAGEVLAALFERCNVRSILRLIETEWKTQEDWLDRELPRPAKNGKPPATHDPSAPEQ